MSRLMVMMVVLILLVGLTYWVNKHQRSWIAEQTVTADEPVSSHQETQTVTAEEKSLPSPPNKTAPTTGTASVTSPPVTPPPTEECDKENNSGVYIELHSQATTNGNTIRKDTVKCSAGSETSTVTNGGATIYQEINIEQGSTTEEQ